MGKPWGTYALSAIVFYEVFAYMADIPSMASIAYNFIRTQQIHPIAFMDPVAESELPKVSLKGTGTAILLTNDGFIATNQHVISGCNRVLLSNGNSRVEPKIVKQRQTYDLAILKIAIKNSASVKRMKIKSPELGEKVLVYGFPFSKILSKNGNLTEGIISALDGGVSYPHLFQLTAPIQSGNSGSGVINEKGELVGIVVSKLGSIKAAKYLDDIPQNVNFAISSDFIKGTFHQLNNYDEPAGVIGQLVAPTPNAQEILVNSSMLVECY